MSTIKLNRTTLRMNIRKIANEAYAYGCQHYSEYDRGYASGVEDLARLLVEHDPAISDRLVAILRAAELDRVIPTSSR